MDGMDLMDAMDAMDDQGRLRWRKLSQRGQRRMEGIRVRKNPMGPTNPQRAQRRSFRGGVEEAGGVFEVHPAGDGLCDSRAIGGAPFATDVETRPNGL